MKLETILGGNTRLARLVVESVECGLSETWVRLAGDSAGALIDSALSAASRDFHDHEEGKRFLRLVCDGPLDPGEPYADYDAPSGPLSDREAETVVEFILSVMVNRFKGDLAELLAIAPAVALVRDRFSEDLEAGSLQLYWGDTIRQSSQRLSGKHQHLKGADGMLLALAAGADRPRARAVFEVKSMRISQSRLEEQLKRHVGRLSNGVSLEGPGSAVTRYEAVEAPAPLLVAIYPSGWKLSRRFTWDAHRNGNRSLVHEAPDETYRPPRAPRDQGSLTHVELGVSQEELEEAAFAMTYWYMGLAGETGLDNAPGRRRDMTFTPSEDGQNRVKHMLYLLGLRPLSDRLRRLTAKLFNVSCYGYPLAIDSRAMLLPEDFVLPASADIGVAPRKRELRSPRTFEFDMTNGWTKWHVERHEGSSAWTGSIELRGLAPDSEYCVGFHVGLGHAAPVAARVCSAGDSPAWVDLEQQPGRSASDPPSPFPSDPVILRRSIGSATVRADRKGLVTLAFRFQSALVESAVRTLVAAFDPA